MPGHEEMVAAVNAYVDAFANGDPEAVVALFAADATVEDPVGTPPHVGHDAIRAFYTGAMKSGAKLRLAGPVRTTTDYAAFAFEVVINHGGQGMVVDVIDTFRFNDEGKAIEMRAFFGPANMKAS
jgi:steroid delta-isomerase